MSQFVLLAGGSEQRLAKAVRSERRRNAARVPRVAGPSLYDFTGIVNGRSVTEIGWR